MLRVSAEGRVKDVVLLSNTSLVVVGKTSPTQFAAVSSVVPVVLTPPS